MTQFPDHALRRPYDYCHPTNAELAPFIGEKWVLGRTTARLRERYPDSNIISEKQYRTAIVKAIEARGWARPAEKALRDLLELLGRTVATQNGARIPGSDGIVIVGGRNILGELPEVTLARSIIDQTIPE